LLSREELAKRLNIFAHGSFPERVAARLEVKAHIAALEADNAAVVRDRQELRTALGIYNAYIADASLEVQNHFNGIVRITQAAWAVYSKMLDEQPHPGAALLEEHRRALARARNEGLERAADMAWTNDPDSELAAAIRRKKEAEE
jgi:NADH dehydrogenase/NADH:ubiquinone oxidoreductase subunit G